MTSLENSYQYCRQVSRERARNFYYSFLLLPKAKRDAMCAVYAFMRRCDDLSDDEGASMEGLNRWRAELEQTLSGRPADHPLWPAFADTVRRYGIPGTYFHEMIDGVSGDLKPRQFETFDELYRYCYLVASVVGLTIIHIFGYDSPRALELAEKCGVAFQLTNIIRDVKEDAENGRVYIPGVPLAEARSPSVIEHARGLGQRARVYYEESRPLLTMVDKDSRASLWALIEIYRRLLDRIEESGYQVLDGRIHVPAWQKTAIVVRAWLR